jgi:SAM-dependent methyltransferase
MKIQIYFNKILRIVLLLIYRFDWWHTSPLDNRKYAKDIILELNKRSERGSLIEIGCGLGDILGKAKYDRKYFYDISPNVLSAAKFLQKFSQPPSINTYKKFDFLIDTLASNLRFDAIVLVNWIHGYDRDILKSHLNKIVNNNLNKNGLIIFDVVEDNSNYKFNHSATDLLDLQQFNFRILDGYPFGRKIVFAELK